MDGSALKQGNSCAEQSLDAGGLSLHMGRGRAEQWGEEGQSTWCSSLGDKVLRASWSLPLWEEKLQFFQSTARCQKSPTISDCRLEMKAASLFFPT